MGVHGHQEPTPLRAAKSVLVPREVVNDREDNDKGHNDDADDFDNCPHDGGVRIRLAIADRTRDFLTIPAGANKPRASWNYHVPTLGTDQVAVN